MLLYERFVQNGNWLFRWRGYLPLVLIVPMFASLEDFAYPRSSHTLDNAWEFGCIILSGLGLAIRVLTVSYTPQGTSGRKTRRQVAEQLNTKGMYSLIRHPLYLGNFLVGLGVFLFLRVWWLPLIYGLAFTLYYERIMLAEEEFLREKFGELFLEWARKTPAFFPSSVHWERPDLPFSFKTALRREYQSFFHLKQRGKTSLTFPAPGYNFHYYNSHYKANSYL